MHCLSHHLQGRVRDSDPMRGHGSDSSVGPGYFFFHPSGFLVFLFYLLFVKFVSITFGSQPCRTHSHQREIPTTYRLCWVLSGFGLVGLDWVGVRQHGLGWSWVGLETHHVQKWKHTASVGLRRVWLEVAWVELEPPSLVTTEHHPSVVLTAVDVYHFFNSTCSRSSR